MKNQFELTIKGHLSEGRNVLFVNSEEDNSGFSEDFITYLWANFYSGITRKGTYFHIDTPLSIEEKIAEMSYDEAEELFLTDNKIEHDINYKGWDFSFDNQTNAAYFYDPKSLLELYCSPSFEGDWGKIVFCLSSQYNFENGDNTLTIEEINVMNMAGDIKGQYKIWEKTAHAILDNIKQHVKQYDDFVLETGISKAVNNYIGDKKYCDLLRNNIEQLARIDALKDALIIEVKKSK
jgi:hypothetical protein